MGFTITKEQFEAALTEAYKQGVKNSRYGIQGASIILPNYPWLKGVYELYVQTEFRMPVYIDAD